MEMILQDLASFSFLLATLLGFEPTVVHGAVPQFCPMLLQALREATLSEGVQHDE